MILDVVDNFQHCFVAHSVKLFIIQKHPQIADADAIAAVFGRALYREIGYLLIDTPNMVYDAAVAE